MIRLFNRSKLRTSGTENRAEPSRKSSRVRKGGGWTSTIFEAFDDYIYQHALQTHGTENNGRKAVTYTIQKGGVFLSSIKLIKISCHHEICGVRLIAFHKMSVGYQMSMFHLQNKFQKAKSRSIYYRIFICFYICGLLTFKTVFLCELLFKL